jgi:hypothetical protein
MMQGRPPMESAYGVQIFGGQPVFFRDRKQLADFALRHKIASVYGLREWVDAGGLFSYGVNLPAMYRRAAELIDTKAKGAKVANLPVEQPTKFELILNMKTADAIGVTISPGNPRARRRGHRVTDPAIILDCFDAHSTSGSGHFRRTQSGPGAGLCPQYLRSRRSFVHRSEERQVPSSTFCAAENNDTFRRFRRSIHPVVALLNFLADREL